MKRSQFFASIIGLITAGCSGFSTKPPPIKESEGILSLKEQIRDMPDNYLFKYYLIGKNQAISSDRKDELAVFLCHTAQQELKKRGIFGTGRFIIYE